MIEFQLPGSISECPTSMMHLDPLDLAQNPIPRNQGRYMEIYIDIRPHTSGIKTSSMSKAQSAEF